MEDNGRRRTRHVDGDGDDDHEESNHHHQQAHHHHHRRRQRGGGGDLLGRHRLSAAISRLDKEIESLKKELEELETMEPSSAPCKQVISSTERLPDALLPVTRGPENPTWDRWFQRIRSSRGHKWWANKASSSFS